MFLTNQDVFKDILNTLKLRNAGWIMKPAGIYQFSFLFQFFIIFDSLDDQLDGAVHAEHGAV